MNIVAGPMTCANGTVVLDGTAVNDPCPDRAVVFQNHSLLPWLTCRENVRLAVDQVFGRTKPRAERAAWVDESLNLVRMLPHASQRPADIGGGMKQRFGALDTLTRAHLQDQVMEIHARLGTTVLMISHDVDDAVPLSDRIAMLTNGPEATIGEVLDVDIPRPRDRLGLAHSDTKRHAAALADWPKARITVDQPLNIHLTGCHHCCAQHFVADICLLGVKVERGEDLVEGYDLHVGSGGGPEQAIVRLIRPAIAFDALGPAILALLQACQAAPSMRFPTWSAAHDDAALAGLPP